MSALIVTINLPGAIGGAVKHVDKQKHTVQLTGETITKTILHTDREEKECKKVLNISESIVQQWESNTVPGWESDRNWKRMNRNQRIISYLSALDEGYGITFEFV
jgi:hypothetical protein